MNEFDQLFEDADKEMMSAFGGPVVRVGDDAEFTGMFGTATKEGGIGSVKNKSSMIPVDIAGPYLEMFEQEASGINKDDVLKLESGALYVVVKVLPDGTGMAYVQLKQHQGGKNDGERWR